MNKSVVVYGPPGCGKTFNAERIRKALGLVRVVDNWFFHRTPDVSEVGVLLLSIEKPPEDCPFEVMPFHDAMIVRGNGRPRADVAEANECRGPSR